MSTLTATPASAGQRPDAGPDRRLRVVHSALQWLPQTQTWMFNQARALPTTIENHVVCETTANLEVFPMEHVHCLADGSKLSFAWDKMMRGARLRRHLGHLPRVLRRVDAAVLHSHFGHIGWMDLRAAKRTGVGHVVTFYGQDVTLLPRLDPRWRERYREMFESVDVVLCEGSHMARKVVELGCPEDRVQVHHLGVDLEAFRFRPRTLAAGERLRVLLSGSFTEKKGLPDGIRALGRLRDELDFEVTVIGDANKEPRNQEEKRRILAAIEETGLSDRVRLLGYQPHTALMEQAYTHHLFLSPSVHAKDGDTEGGAPVTLLEVAATGMPVVSTTHCDIPSVVKHGETGLLAAEHDVEDLARHLRTLARTPESWAVFGAAARRHVESEYDLRKQGAALANVYRSVARR